tara:strand:+ start:5934 stop:6395 length:462 start_codon:yes stop_codon:yes gene_type:complete
MKKIILYFCFLIIYGCTGYEPLFSTKNSNYYIINIENVNKDNLTQRISKRLDNYKSVDDNKKGYILKISSNMKNIVSSKDSKGQVSTYEMIVNVDLKVFSKDSNRAINSFKFNKNFIYNNQENKSNLSQYKKDILKNLINKISQEIIIKLQSL